LIETAGRAIAQARNEIPGGRKIQFMEGVRSRVKLADASKLWATMKKPIRDLIETDPWFTGENQFVRLKNGMLLAASSTVDETTDPEKVRKAMTASADKMLAGAEATIGAELVTAATNLTSKVYNSSRIEFFLEPEAKNQIVAFRFENPDPKTPLCQSLNNQEFPVDDPESAKWLPPLHHNCKSFIVPILDSQRIKGEVKTLAPKNPDLVRFKTL